jgi:hypothetical protein
VPEENSLLLQLENVTRLQTPPSISSLQSKNIGDAVQKNLVTSFPSGQFSTPCLAAIQLAGHPTTEYIKKNLEWIIADESAYIC